MFCKAITTLGNIIGLTCVRSWSADNLAIFKLETGSGNWYFGIGDNGFSDRTGLFKLHRFEDLRDDGYWFHDICLLATMCPLLNACRNFRRYYNIIPGAQIELIRDEEQAWGIVKHDTASFLTVDPLDHLVDIVCWVNVDGTAASEQDAIQAFSKILPLVHVAADNTARLGEEGFRYARYASNLEHFLYRWLLGHEVRLQSDESGSCIDEGKIGTMEALARKWHAGQFRKGPGNVPYIVHPEAVVEKLRDWGYNDREDAVTLAVAWGHDLLEDTKCPEEDIIAAGGAEVLAGIKALSFLPPKTQPLTNEEWDKKKDEYIHNVAATAAPEILVVKMADRICNTMDFIRANNKWGYEYLVLGECLFDRVMEMKKGERIAEEFDYVQTLTTTLESGGFDKESYDEWSERLRLDMP